MVSSANQPPSNSGWEAGNEQDHVAAAFFKERYDILPATFLAVRNSFANLTPLHRPLTKCSHQNVGKLVVSYEEFDRD